MEVILDSGADLSCLPMFLGDHDFGTTAAVLNSEKRHGSGATGKPEASSYV